MKKVFFSFMAFALLIVNFFVAPTPAKAALTLTVISDKTSVVYYEDNGLTVSLRSFPGTVIVYTTDGTTPQASLRLSVVTQSLVITHGIKYTGPITITGNKTIKAIALYDILTPVSPVASFSYEVYKPSVLIDTVKQKSKGFVLSSYPSTITYKAKNGSTGSLTKTYAGIKPNTVNCTWYTFVRIKYNLNRTVLFTSAGGLDGKYWYSKIASTSNQVKYPSLEKLIEENKNRPIYNVVVSFERNPGGTNGHVLLIDAIINGKVYYSDNYQPGVLVVCNSVRDFKNKYSGSNGSILGVVHMK